MQLTPDNADLARGFDRHFSGDIKSIGIAVSGGGDSVALLRVAVLWAETHGVTVHAATVDHGLRPGAAQEALWVQNLCVDLGVEHRILTWNREETSGNLQAQARDARYDLLAGWAREAGLSAVCLGHTRDDQAETFVMRLARGSGVDGLAAMRSDWIDRDVRWLRPVLDVPRDRLRAVLQDLGQDWLDDPSNEDTRFERVKVRKALKILQTLGLEQSRMIETAQRMALARSALDDAMRVVAQKAVTQNAASLVVDLHALRAASREVQLRVFAAVLAWVGGQPYRPRFDALQQVWDRVQTAGTRTLHGVLMASDGAEVRCLREHRAVRDRTCATTEIWDGKWHLTGPDAPDLRIRALGEDGVRACPGWRASGYDRRLLLSSPAVYRDDHLVAAPLAQNGGEWTARIVTDFTQWMESH